MPFALPSKVTSEIGEMVKKVILEPVSCSGATSVVPVVKKNDSIRLFADYYSTVNQVVKQFIYLLSTVYDVLATMKGGRIFSMFSTFGSIFAAPIDEQTSRALTLNTIRKYSKLIVFHFAFLSILRFFKKE